MGSRSRSKGNSTAQSTSNTMAGLANGKTSNSEMMGLHQDMQRGLLGNIFPAFGAMVQDGMKSFGDNPMANVMGAILGMPIKTQAPDFLTSFIEKYKTPEPPVQPTQQQQFGAMPQQPQFDINRYMQNQFMGPRR